MKSEFEKASNQKEATHTHNCLSVRPYADETLLDQNGSVEIICRRCGRTERHIIHFSKGIPQPAEISQPILSRRTTNCKF
jgi:hypothetical protein